MSESFPLYRIFYTLKDGNILMSGNGPMDYRRNAIAERRRIIREVENVKEAWIEKEGVKTGAVERK